MLLRKILILFVLGIALSIFSFFFLSTVSPFKIQKIEELIIEKEVPEDDFGALVKELGLIKEKGGLLEYINSNAYVGFGLILLSIFFFFTSAHLGIDKLFFRKFYENPSFFDAFRRGFLLILSLGLVIYLNLLNLTWQELLIVPLILLLLELMFFFLFKKELQKSWSDFRKKVGKEQL